MFRSNRYLLVATTIGVVSILCLMALYRQLAVSALVDHESRSNEALTRVMANVVWEDYRELIELDSTEILTRGANHPTIVKLDHGVKKAMRGSRLIKVKIYNSDGIVVFSTDPSQIGEDKSTNKGFSGAVSGETVSLSSFAISLIPLNRCAATSMSCHRIFRCVEAEISKRSSNCTLT